MMVTMTEADWAAPGTVTVGERYIEVQSSTVISGPTDTGTAGEVQSSTVTATGGTVSPR